MYRSFIYNIYWGLLWFNQLASEGIGYIKMLFGLQLNFYFPTNAITVTLKYSKQAQEIPELVSKFFMYLKFSKYA